MSRPLVIYHKACVDGWCSAWIFDRCFGGVDVLPANYGDEPPNVDGRTVFVLDFSYPRDVMIGMNRESHSLVVLDHHKSARQDCADLEFCQFDEEQSGAGLSYWWCYDRGYVTKVKDRSIGRGMKSLAMYVQDRDLFRFSLDASEDVNACIRSYPFDLETWDYIAKRMAVTPMGLVQEGEAIQRYRRQIVEQAIRHARITKIGQWNVPLALCSTADIISEVGGKLAAGHPFAATYCPTSDGLILVSLRSDEDGLDCSEIARLFGGGGHARAAGFKLPFHVIEEIRETGVLLGGPKWGSE